MTNIRFLHTADLHLDTPFKGMAQFPAEQFAILKESTFQAFSNFIAYAVRTKPDFIVIVGDIYDGEERSLRAQLKFQEGMKLLQKAEIPVYLSYGNHDHLKGNWTRFELPENVHVFNGEVEGKSLQVRGETVNLYGFSYPERHVRQAMIDLYPVAENDAFHIGLLHGSVDGDETHAVYAPFTKAALLSKRYDYWALGHIHKRQHLQTEPPIVYPGNLQGRHRNERGVKGFYDVTLSKTSSDLTFIPASAIVFENVPVSCQGIRHAGEWFDLCEDVLHAFTEQVGAAVVSLQMVDVDAEADALFQQTSEEEWLFALRDRFQHHSPLLWIRAIQFERQVIENDASEILLNPVMETMEHWGKEDWETLLSDLYQHTRSMKYLERLTAEEVEEIQMEVEKSLRIELSERR